MISLKSVASLFLVTMTGLLSACTNHAATLDSLNGQWSLISTHHQGKALYLTTANPARNYWLSLTDNRVTGRSACNHWQGTSQAQAQTLSISLTGKTKKRCHFDSQEEAQLAQRFPEALDEGASFKRSKDRLKVTLPNGDVWLFHKSP